MSTIEAVIDHFHDADICVGIHGAGLANCVLVRGAKKKKLMYICLRSVALLILVSLYPQANPGVIVVELQTYHGFGITK